MYAWPDALDALLPDLHDSFRAALAQAMKDQVAAHTELLGRVPTTQFDDGRPTALFQWGQHEPAEVERDAAVVESSTTARCSEDKGQHPCTDEHITRRSAALAFGGGPVTAGPQPTVAGWVQRTGHHQSTRHRVP